MNRRAFLIGATASFVTAPAIPIVEPAILYHSPPCQMFSAYSEFEVLWARILATMCETLGLSYEEISGEIGIAVPREVAQALPVDVDVWPDSAAFRGEDT